MHLIAITEIIIQLFFINHAIKNRKPRHWLLILLIPWVGFILYYFIEILAAGYDKYQEEKKEYLHSSGVNLPAGCKLAYTSQGKLFHLKESISSEQIQSPFGQKIIDQIVRVNQKNEWKTQGVGSHFGGSILWGVDKHPADKIMVNITSVTMCPDDNKLYYILETESSGGLFVYDYNTNEENRLFHKEKFKAKDLDINRKTKEFICSQQFANGTSNIILINEDGTDIREITEGDSIDDCPSWIPGEHRQILFQSTGIARSQAGYSAGRGTTTIQALDLDNNRMTVVLEDSRYDFLQPHISVDGYLYFIRRPHEHNQYRLDTAALDFILFPFRLIRAVFHYLNFFSLVYSQKPLTTASGPRIQGDDLKTIVLKGKIINAEKALNTGVKIMGVPSLVPSSWELIRRNDNNVEEVMANNVAAFDIGHDGTIIYSNGYGVFRLDNQKNQQLILKDKLIEDVVIG